MAVSCVRWSSTERQPHANPVHGNDWRGGPSEGMSALPGSEQRERRGQLRREEMKNLMCVAAVALAVGLAALPVLAQEAAKKEPPKPAPGPSEAVHIRFFISSLLS